MEKKREAVLETYVFDNTKSVKLLDKFEGIGESNDTIYERIILNNVWYGYSSDKKSFSYRLVIERRNGKECVGDVTFTEFKKGKNYILKEYIDKNVNEKIIKKHSKSGKIFYFDKPFLLRAQNSRNRTGYGWTWDWSGGIGTSYEGTFYGETSSYIFAGIVIEKY